MMLSMRKTIHLVCILGMLLLSLPTLHAQDFLQKAKNYLDAGECEKAQRAYEAFKVEYPAGNAEVERRIAECGNKTQKTTPEIYVDLGLPSGTLWKSQSEEGLYSYENAKRTYGGKLPTKEQMLELAKNCTWEWTGAGYTVKGRNGNSIFVPSGIRFCNGNEDYSMGGFWSSTKGSPSDFDGNPDNAYANIFNSEGAQMGYTESCNEFPVRLVKNSTKGYVDLGLPSGTLWKNKNENGYYDYDQAVSSFGYSLPSRQQRDELFNECQWVWSGSGYRVIGPNGNEIYLPTNEGYRTCDGHWLYKGERSQYWIRPNDGLYDQGESAQVFFIELSKNNKISGNGWMFNTRCELSSVRLVHN